MMIAECNVRPDWAALSHERDRWARWGQPTSNAYWQFTDFLAATPSARRADALAVAVVFFLPRSAAPPGGAAWDTLIRWAAASRDGGAPSAFDLGLAYGCGWRGTPPERIFAPGDVGEVAVLALMEQVHAALTVTAQLLRDQLGLPLLTGEDIASLAAAFAMSLLGACDCGHHRRGCRQTCGRGCCFPDHDVRNWNPAMCHLRPFVDQAVRGTAQRRILGGAFAESMLYRALAAESRLLCRTVECGRCPVCATVFEGQRCPSPHPTTREPVRREPRKNQLIVPAVGRSGGHVPLQRWWCQRCQHLYGRAHAGESRVGAPGCPHCGRPPDASKAVWTLAPVHTTAALAAALA